MDYKYTDFSGTDTDFDRRQYTYDRNSNRLSIEHALYKAASHSATYDNLDRLTDFKTGILDSSNVVQLSKVAEGLNMDILGNFTSGAGGIKLNSVSTTISHTVNETNEITALGYDNPAEVHTILKDHFTTTLSDIWTAEKGTWSISSAQVNVDTLTSGKALLFADPELDIVNHGVKITFPTGSSSARAGLALFHDERRLKPGQSRLTLQSSSERFRVPRRGRSRGSQKKLVRPWAQLAPVGNRPHGLVGW